jgi:hypothetical protein
LLKNVGPFPFLDDGPFPFLGDDPFPFRVAFPFPFHIVHAFLDPFPFLDDDPFLEPFLVSFLRILIDRTFLIIFIFGK